MLYVQSSGGSTIQGDYEESNQHISINQVSERDVINAIMQLKLKYTAGPDKIPSVLIRECASYWIKPLTILFNLSLKLKTFPDVWKATKVVLK